MFSVMPVCLCKAVFLPKVEKLDNTIYECPIYRTEDRGSTYIGVA